MSGGVSPRRRPCSFPLALLFWRETARFLVSHKNMFDMIAISFRDGGRYGPATASLLCRRRLAWRVTRHDHDPQYCPGCGGGQESKVYHGQTQPLLPTT